MPGFIDSHVHCESTLVPPLEFDRCVVPRGTTTAICDPHEICNVLGIRGLKFFLKCAEVTVMDLRVQLSSCVPATHLETSGARLEAKDLLPFKTHPKVLGLAEMMNVPGVLNKDPGVLHKLAAFSDVQIDGHSPLLSAYDLNAYIAAGVRNCHETTSAAEAREKLAKGMQILIREGTVSKDLAALAELLTTERSPFLALCTDDRNPLDIAEEGHIDYMIRARHRPRRAAARRLSRRHLVGGPPFRPVRSRAGGAGPARRHRAAGGSRHGQGPFRDLPRRAGDAGPLSGRGPTWRWSASTR